MHPAGRYVLYFLVALSLTLLGCGNTNKVEIQIPVSGEPWLTQEEVKGNSSPNTYKAFLATAETGAVIPGLRQQYVPQAIDYWPAKDWFALSGYFEDGKPSPIIIVDAATGEFIKAVVLHEPGSTKYYTGHAGGVAISNNHLWVSSGGLIRYVTLDKIAAAADGETIRFDGQFRVDARGSFMRYADGKVWVGDFTHRGTSSYPPIAHHKLPNDSGYYHIAWVAGYDLDPETDLIASTLHDNGVRVPDYIISIPDKIQEISFFPDKIVLTESYGRNNVSKFLVYNNALLEEPHSTTKDMSQMRGREVPIWFLDGRNEIKDAHWIAAPPMAEGLVERGDTLYILFESAALKFSDGRHALSHIQQMLTETLLAGPK